MKTSKRNTKRNAVTTSTKRETVSALLVDVHVIANPDGYPGVTPCHDTRNTGRYSGLSVAKFQNWVLLQCATEPHTDADIARLWVREHPFNVAYQNKHGAVWYVQHNVRSEYNTGVHSGQNGKPPVDDNGRWNPTPVWSDNGVATYPKYPSKWLTDGKPNGTGPLPDGVNVIV